MLSLYHTPDKSAIRESLISGFEEPCFTRSRLLSLKFVTIAE